MIETIALIFAFLMVTLGTLGRFKYVWQGNKVRRCKSSDEVSRKFLLLSHVIYWIAFGHNFFIGDKVDMVFWGVGLATTFYANVMVYKYYPIKYSSVWAYIKDSFDFKTLISDTFCLRNKKK